MSGAGCRVGTVNLAEPCGADVVRCEGGDDVDVQALMINADSAHPRTFRIPRMTPRSANLRQRRQGTKTSFAEPLLNWVRYSSA